MPDLKVILSEEIRRLAKKEIKLALAPLLKNAVEQRRTIAELKKRIAVLENRPAAVEDKKTDTVTDSAEKKLRLYPVFYYDLIDFLKKR